MSSRIRLRRPRFLIALLVVVALVSFPLGMVYAMHNFDDVPNTNPFHADIDAIFDAGVTTGCGGGNYCPDDVVTREQMAAFMNRLGALGPGKTPVVDADKLEGLEPAQLSVQGWDVVEGSNVSLDIGEFGTATATCPAGTNVLGGGWSQTDGVPSIDVFRNRPTAAADGWQATGENVSGNNNRTFRAFAICGIVN